MSGGRRQSGGGKPKRLPGPQDKSQGIIVIQKTPMSDLLRRLGRDSTVESVEDQSNAALGCKTSSVALALLAQMVRLEHQNPETMSEAQVDTALTQATALLAELHPTTATEAMLAAQMVGGAPHGDDVLNARNEAGG
jgi:hypothetical protein